VQLSARVAPLDCPWLMYRAWTVKSELPLIRAFRDSAKSFLTSNWEPRCHAMKWLPTSLAVPQPAECRMSEKVLSPQPERSSASGHPSLEASAKVAFL
jgi:hypothetical protein